MSAYHELASTGRLGREGVDMLYKTVAAVARIRRFPPPEGYESWEPDAVLEVAHDFLVDRPGVDRMRQLFLLATDDMSLQRLLHQAVRNHLRSRARATEFGALMRRIRSVLEHDERFAVTSGDGIPRWTLRATGARDPFTGQIESLIEASWRVHGLRLSRWNSETRRSPHAERDSLARLCEHVLRAAQTTLPVNHLARVVAARLNVGQPPMLVDLDERLAKPGDVAGQDSVGTVLVVDEAAHAAWSQLTERERLLVPLLEESVRAAAGRVGLGKSQAAVAMKRIRSVLADACSDGVELGAVARRLQDIADESPRTN